MADTTQQAWDAFERYVAQARERMQDRWVPIAMVCVQAQAAEGGGVDLMLWNDARVIWPADFPIAERGPLLARLAKPYADGTVLR